MKIAVAGAGYVGLSNAVLLAQHNEVIVVDVLQEKVDMINNRKSPIIDMEIEDYLSNKELNLTAPQITIWHIKMQNMSSLQHLPTTILKRTISIPDLLRQ